ncbi:uncharacterized protein LOC141655319 [Silene latifolia]|uniref:uncharacterized protein LOC141655319 n=1 Tax=Silene latifolia TaxID=37657 RepID=UPI003D779CE0
MGKLKKARLSLRELHSTTFSNLSGRVEAMETYLARCLKELHEDPLSANLIAKERELSHSLAALKTAEYSMLTQRAKIYDEVQNIDPDIIANGKCVEPADFDILTRPISVEEIKNALFSIGSNKSPDLDGFSAGFFKAAWDIVSMNFCKAVKEFFKSSFMPKQANVIVLSLIPKKKVVQSVKVFRPISCCSIIYKTISKILTNRLQCILPKLVGIEQAAFVKNRSLFENIMLTQGLVKGYQRSYLSPRCMLKINGSNHGFFKGKSGVRQGDPLSPSLFILSMKILSRCLKVMRKEQDVLFHPKCAKLKINHLVFANELMIFTRGDLPFVRKAADILHLFSTWSGLYASFEKTEAYFGGISASLKHEILSEIGLNEGVFPFRYLGIPVHHARLTHSMYDGLALKLADLLYRCSSKYLSYAGRIQIINSVIFGLGYFWGSSILLPKAVCNFMNKACRNLIWYSSESRKMTFKSWSSICLPWCYFLSASNIWHLQVREFHPESLRGVLNVREWCAAKMGSLQKVKELLLNCTVRGHFSISKAYENLRPHVSPQVCFKAVNKRCIIPRHRITLLMVVQEKLATAELLNSRGLHIPNRCCLSKAAGKSSRHLFFNCRYSKELLSLIASWTWLTATSNQLKELLILIMRCQFRKPWLKNWILCCIVVGLLLSTTFGQNGIDDYLRGRRVFLLFLRPVSSVYVFTGLAGAISQGLGAEFMCCKLQHRFYTVMYYASMDMLTLRREASDFQDVSSSLATARLVPLIDLGLLVLFFQHPSDNQLLGFQFQFASLPFIRLYLEFRILQTPVVNNGECDDPTGSVKDPCSQDGLIFANLGVLKGQCPAAFSVYNDMSILPLLLLQRQLCSELQISLSLSRQNAYIKMLSPGILDQHPWRSLAKYG